MRANTRDTQNYNKQTIQLFWYCLKLMNKKVRDPQISILIRGRHPAIVSCCPVYITLALSEMSFILVVMEFLYYSIIVISY